MAPATLTPKLQSVEALYRKLEREFVRAFHHKNLVHKSDHFYNFCVTAHSMRDHFLERLGKVDRSDRAPYINAWDLEPCIVAVMDIANTVKHYQLRTKKGLPKSPRAKRVSDGKTTLFDVFLTSDGTPTFRKRSNVPTIIITLEDGGRLEMYEFMESVRSYWNRLLSTNGIRVRRQSWTALHGKAS